MKLETYLRAKELAEYQAITMYDDVFLGTPGFDTYVKRQRQAKAFTRRIIRISAKMNKRIAGLEADNAKLRATLARLTAAAGEYLEIPYIITRRELRQAIAEATAALGAEAGGAQAREEKR